MRTDNKRALYEKIMRNVSRVVKRTLNEAKWIDLTDDDDPTKISDETKQWIKEELPDFDIDNPDADFSEDDFVKLFSKAMKKRFEEEGIDYEGAQDDEDDEEDDMDDEERAEYEQDMAEIRKQFGDDIDDSLGGFGKMIYRGFKDVQKSMQERLEVIKNLDPELAKKMEDGNFNMAEQELAFMLIDYIQYGSEDALEEIKKYIQNKNSNATKQNSEYRRNVIKELDPELFDKWISGSFDIMEDGDIMYDLKSYIEYGDEDALEYIKDYISNKGW